MSWVALAPATPINPKPSKGIVTMTVSKPGRMRARAYVTVQCQLLDGALAWWSNLRPVGVEIGDADHEGRVRISDAGPHRIMGATGRGAAAGKPCAPTLQITGLPGMPADGMRRVDVPWEIVGDALVINLPWAAAKGATKAPPADAPPTPPIVPVKAAVPPARAFAVKAPAPASSSGTARAPEPATYGQIERWAGERGLSSAGGFELDIVNAKRVQLGLAPFAIKRVGRPA